jgi:hypothetical protein
MLSFKYKPYMLSVVMLNVFMLSAVELNVVAPTNLLQSVQNSNLHFYKKTLLTSLNRIYY